MQNEEVTRVAEKNGRTAAQTLLRWGLQRGYSVIPKSAKSAHSQVRCSAPAGLQRINCSVVMESFNGSLYCSLCYTGCSMQMLNVTASRLHCYCRLLPACLRSLLADLPPKTSRHPSLAMFELSSFIMLQPRISM